ncbi:Gmad2 immunoglobulin-like domain-containing protein [Nocardioides sp.]|uniref:Gmad2 immunoglobulin-like domain-containing protein n=1 Tax=Nocardioides sp. TaxID=35761 RepID=UPI0039E707C7
MRNSTPFRRLPVAVATVATLALAGCGSSDSEATEDASTAVESSQSPSPEETTATATVAPPTASATYTEPSEVTDITLSSPADGATVSGSIDVSGTANSVEANVPWLLVDAAGAVVQQGAFTAEGWMDKLYPFSGSVDLAGVAPGAYSFVVSTDDPSDGEGKQAQQVEVHITVS